jgi:predicted amidophosphoribosyltransferase
MSIDPSVWKNVLSKNLVPIPWSGEDVCPMCNSWKFPADRICNNCVQVTTELAHPCSKLIPISLYRKPSLLRDWLKFYKPGAEDFKPRYGDAIAAILELTLARQSERLTDRLGNWDYMVVVPSTLPSESHPLEQQLKVVGFEHQLARPLLRTQVPLGHRIMSDSGYAVTTDVKGKRFLLIDDVYTTGARSQSAASALQLAGGVVVAIVVIGRRINVEYNEFTERVWNRQLSKEFRFEAVFDRLPG